MLIATPKDIGLLIRDRRRVLGLSQEGLAQRARVGRPWLSRVERGKSSAEVGLVLRVLRECGVVLDAGFLSSHAGDSGGESRPAMGAPRGTRRSGDPVHRPAVDLDALIGALRKPG